MSTKKSKTKNASISFDFPLELPRKPENVTNSQEFIKQLNKTKKSNVTVEQITKSVDSMNSTIASNYSDLIELNKEFINYKRITDNMFFDEVNGIHPITERMWENHKALRENVDKQQDQINSNNLFNVLWLSLLTLITIGTLVYVVVK